MRFLFFEGILYVYTLLNKYLRRPLEIFDYGSPETTRCLSFPIL